jgi:hypothetical protein
MALVQAGKERMEINPALLLARERERDVLAEVLDDTDETLRLLRLAELASETPVDHRPAVVGKPGYDIP